MSGRYYGKCALQQESGSGSHKKITFNATFCDATEIGFYIFFIYAVQGILKLILNAGIIDGSLNFDFDNRKKTKFKRTITVGNVEIQLSS